MSEHHSHNHAPANYGKAFISGILLNLAFVVIEASYGLLSSSLALVADAGHNFSDVIGLVLAFVAMLLVKRLPSSHRTYGMRRTSILAALANSLLLLVAVGAIAWEAVQRFAHPEPVAGVTVMIVAGIGIVINSLTAFLFMSGRHKDLNLKGAYLHMAADAGVSLGVVIAGFLMLQTGWLWLDPVVSLVIALVITWATWGLFKDSLNMALDAVPTSVDQEKVIQYLKDLPGVKDVHDVHIWGISTTEIALTAHLVVGSAADSVKLLPRISYELHDQFHIVHPTIQFEDETTHKACELAPNEAV